MRLLHKHKTNNELNRKLCWSELPRQFTTNQSCRDA